MTHTEWELLAVADDIEQGDTLEVELEDGSSTLMILISVSRGAVKLMDEFGVKHRFSTASLESMDDGNSFIVGKSEEKLEIKK